MAMSSRTIKPIYPPNSAKAVVYLMIAFVSFLVAAFYGNLLLIILTGITLAASSSFLGEQLYKSNVYKEILYHRALETMISLKDDENGN